MEKDYKSLEHAIRGVFEASTLSSPRGVITGHVRSGRAGYSSSAERGQAGGHSTAMKRVAAQEAEAEKEQNASKDKMEAEIKKRTQAADKRTQDLQKKVSEAADPDRNTEERKKVKVVSRPDDAKPTSPESKLARTAQYKTKIIDEENPLMFSDKSFGLPKGLLDTVRNITEKKAVKDDDKDDDKKKSDKDDEKNPKTVSGDKTEVDTEPTTDDKLDNQLDTPAPKKPKKNDVKEAINMGAVMHRAERKAGAAEYKAHMRSKAEKPGEEGEPARRWLGYPAGTSHEKVKQVNAKLASMKKEEVEQVAEAEATHPKSAKEKKLAALAAPKDKITHKDVLVGRGVIKEKEEVLSVEEIENLQAIAQQFDEGKQVPDRATITGAPLRGANQDQSGFNDKNNAADYTISDEKKRK